MTDWQSRREARGLSRGRLAAKLGVSVDTVRRWEMDKYGQSPALAYQRKMRAILGDGQEAEV